MRNELNISIRCVFILIVTAVIAAMNASAETTNAIRLLQLAEEHFTNDLTVPEGALFVCAATGTGALDGPEGKSSPTNPASWTNYNVIRASRLEWLCTDPAAAALVTYHGIEFYHFQINGTLNLQSARVSFPIFAHQCVFSDDIILNGSHIDSLNLVQCCIKGIAMEEAKVDGDIILREDPKIEGTVNLANTAINGNLDCDGSHFIGSNGYSLIANRANIGGDAHLNGKLTAVGCVSFQGANIGGQLNCDGGEFSNPNSVALDCNGASIEMGVILKDDFRANGEVDFTAATIYKNLECEGGHFLNPNSLAFVADGAKVEGSVFLRDDFSANGMVELGDISIGRNLDCRGGSFFNPNAIALMADRAKIGGSVLFWNSKTTGELRLSEISIGGSFECDGAQFRNPAGDALNAEGAEITGAVFLRNGFSAEGGLWLVQAHVGSDLDCSGGHFYGLGTNTPALAVDGATIAGNANLNNGFVAEGLVSVARTTIHGDLRCEDAHFIHHDDLAVRADDTAVDGDANFARSRCDGEVTFFGSSVAGSLIFDSAVLSKSGTNGPALDFINAKVNGDVILDHVDLTGQLLFIGASIGNNLDCRGAELMAPNGFTLLGNQAAVGGSVFLSSAFKSNGEVRLEGTKIGNDMACDEGQFTQTNPEAFAINLIGAEIHGNLLLWTNFSAVGMLNFKGLNVGHIFFLNGIRAPDKMILDLRLAKVNYMFDDEKSWPDAGNLFLDNFTYNELYSAAPADAKTRIEWLHRQPADRFFAQPYEQLAEVLRNMGHEDDAAEIMVAKNKDYARQLPWYSLSRLWYNFIGLLAGYGYLPGRAFMISLIFITFGMFLFSFAHRNGKIKGTDEKETETRGRHRNHHHRKSIGFNPFIYSLETFVPLLELDMAKQWRPDGQWLRTYFYLHRIGGWVLTTLWVGGLTGLIKT